MHNCVLYRVIPSSCNLKGVLLLPRVIGSLLLLIIALQGSSQCNFAGVLYGTAAAPTVGCTVVQPSLTCHYLDEFAAFTGIVPGATYKFTGTLSSSCVMPYSFNLYASNVAGTPPVAFVNGSVSPLTITYTVPGGGPTTMYVKNFDSNGSACGNACDFCHNFFIECISCPPPTPTIATTQPSTAAVVAGSTNVQVLRIDLGAQCSTNTLTSVNLTTGLTTNLADLLNAKVYYTTTTTFSTTTQFGSTVVSPGANFVVNGSQAMANGANYLWLVYDVSCAAANGNLIDGAVDAAGVVLSSGSLIPSTLNPTGTRPVTGIAIVTTQPSTTGVVKGTTNVQVLRYDLSGIPGAACGTITLNDVNVDLSGSTNLADISTVKVYYTTSITFSTTTQFGSSMAPATNMTFSGTQTLAAGANYIWVVFDVACSATTGNILDASGTSLVLSSGTLTPSTPNPTGTRAILGTTVATNQPSTAGVTAGTANVVVLRVDLTNLPVTACSTYVNSLDVSLAGTTNLADVTAVKVYYTTTTTFSTTTQFGTTMSPAGTLTFTGSQLLTAASGYLHVVFDVACNATAANLLDASATSVSLSSGTLVPSTPNPTGTRAILGIAVATTQPSSASVPAGSANVVVLRVDLTNIPATACSTYVNSLDVSLAGTTNLADVLAVKVYYTTTTTFSTTTQFSTSMAPAGTLTFTGSQLLSGGSGYLHVVFDVACTATVTNVLDAGATSVSLSSGTLIPATPNPTGTRAITAAAYTAATVQPSTANVLQGSIDNQILRVQLTGCVGSVVTSIDFNTTGSTNPATDITAARIYFTTTTTFSNSVQFGSQVNNPNGLHTVTGSQVLSLATGYFWLVYDISPTATVGNVIDASNPSSVIGGNTVIPTTQNPTGTRPIVAPPPNDAAQNAILLALNTPCSGNPYTNVNASLGVGEPYPNCSGVAGTPVWFKFVAPTSGAVRVTLDILPIGTFVDSKVAIFSASDPTNYATFSLISCDDDGGSAAGSGYLSVVYATGLIGGTTYYINVDKYTPTTTAGTFCIQVDEFNTSMISTTNTCSSSYQTVVNNGVTNYTEWIPLLDGSSKLVAMVRYPAGGGNPSLFSPAQNVHPGAVRNFQGTDYLDRNFYINNSSTANFMVQLFFLDAEFNDLALADPSVSNLSDLKITKTIHPTTPACATDFDDQPAMLLNQLTSNSVGGVSWLQFIAPTHGNFFIHAGLVALPIDLLSFNAEGMKNYNMVTWQTASEMNAANYLIQRASSANGNFETIGQVEARNRNGESYSFIDHYPKSIGYYRLKMMDLDGQYNFSNTVLVKRKSDRFSILNVYPVPSAEVVYVDITNPESIKTGIVIADITGKMIRTIDMELAEGDQTIEVSLDGLQPGTYFLTILGEVKKVIKF